MRQYGVREPSPMGEGVTFRRDVTDEALPKIFHVVSVFDLHFRVTALRPVKEYRLQIPSGEPHPSARGLRRSHPPSPIGEGLREAFLTDHKTEI